MYFSTAEVKLDTFRFKDIEIYIWQFGSQLFTSKIKWTKD